MAKVIEITNPLTGQPQQVIQSDYTAQQIDDLLTMAPDNLLDNTNFQNPVNQRGVSGTISTAGFFIDRWYLVSGTVQLTAAGLILNGTIQQTREFSVGYPTTASALTTAGIVTASYDDSTKIFTLTGTGQTFVTAKLELGSVSTVGYQNVGGVWVPTRMPKYVDELARCQRFLYLTTTSTASTYYLATIVSGNIFVPVIVPVPMRSTPSITASQCTLYYGTGGATVDVSLLLCYDMRGNQALCRADGVATGVSDRTGIVEIGGLQLNAEL